jgi:serine/threonine-protein kinase
MTPDQWSTVFDLFDAALERPADSRMAWLDNTCDDAFLRDEVLKLLRTDAESGEFLERPAIDVVTEWAEPASPDAKIGHHIGPYQLIRLLGRGGMGRVYLAERNDGQFEQRVAMKLLSRDGYGQQFRHRFLEERQILASLNHPHIARLFDGGMTTDGTPYFAMEYVDGQPIDQYCRSHGCSIRNRLLLFQAVCDAVQYAHQNLIVHRDLKPSNILVTDEGTVKLLDFGIAKLVKSEPAATHQTTTRLRWITPEYASPEQVRGGVITTASDVYQLGVVLYELLTERRPFNVRGKRPSEAERILCTEAPARPSSVASTDAAHTALRGDLDTIVLKALRKEPERRYASVEALVEDVKRYLAGRPVTAQPDTWLYRSRKFVGRHRQGVVMAAIGLLLVIGLGFLYTYQVTQERNRAQLEAQKSARVTTFMTELLQEFDPSASTGGTVSAQAVLDRAVTRLEREMTDQPDVQARLLSKIGQIHQSYGRYDDAQALLTTALERRRHLHGPRHPEVAESLKDVAWLLRVRGDYVSSEAYYRRALTMQRDLLGPRHPDVAASLEGLGLVLHVRGQSDEAEALLREALSQRRQLLPDQHPELAENLSSLANLLYTRFQYDEAERLFREALAIRRAVFGTHLHVAQTLNDLAALLVARDRNAEAEPMYRESLAMRRSLLGDVHPHVAQSLSHLGLLLERRGDYDRAKALVDEALGIRRQHFGERHLSVANSLNLLGWLRHKQGAHAQGATNLRQAITLYRALLGDDHVYVASGLNKLGAIQTAARQFATAEVTLEEALAIVQAQFSMPHPRIADVLSSQGALHMARNQPARAVPRLRQALMIRRDVLGPTHRRTVDVQTRLGACLLSMQRFDEAEALLLESRAVLTRHAPDRPNDLRRVHNHLEALYRAWDRPEQAAAFAEATS